MKLLSDQGEIEKALTLHLKEKELEMHWAKTGDVTAKTLSGQRWTL